MQEGELLSLFREGVSFVVYNWAQITFAVTAGALEWARGQKTKHKNIREAFIDDIIDQVLTYETNQMDLEEYLIDVLSNQFSLMEDDPDSIRAVAATLLRLYAQLEKGITEEYDGLKSMNEKMKGLKMDQKIAEEPKCHSDEWESDDEGDEQEEKQEEDDDDGFQIVTKKGKHK